MSERSAHSSRPQLDLSDVDHRVGKPVTYVDGEVIAKETNSAFGVPLVTVAVRMTNQDGTILVDGTAEVELPH